MIINANTNFDADVNTEYRVEMTNDNGTTWKWAKRTKMDDWSVPTAGSWGSYTDVTSYTLNDSNGILLSDGVKVQFIKSSKADYNNGDWWQFTMTVKSVLDSDETGSYSNMKIINNGGKRHLVLMKNSSGQVVEIKNFESSSPSFIKSSTTIGGGDSIDICSKNKELYIGRGESSSPKWLGYTKYNGFENTLETPNLISSDSYKVLDIDSNFIKILDDYIYLVGPVTETSNVKQKNSSIIAGIKYGENVLYICYLDVVNDGDEGIEATAGNQTGTVFKYHLENAPIRVRPDVSQYTTKFYVKGVAVLCEPETEDYINTLDFFTIPVPGSGSYTPGDRVDRVKRIHLKKPEAFDIDNKSFSDFVIVSSNAHHGHSSSPTYHMALSFSFTADESEHGKKGQRCLYRVEDLSSITDGKIVDDTGTGANGKYIGITPKLDFGADTYSETGNVSTHSKELFVLVLRESSGYSVVGSMGIVIADVPKVSLCNGGWDDNGLYPQLQFTCSLKPPKWESTGTAVDVGMVGPLWLDSARQATGSKLWALCTVTFVTSFAATDNDQSCTILAHFRHTDLGNPNVGWDEISNKYPDSINIYEQGDWLKASIGNINIPPASYPLFGVTGRARKYNIYGHGWASSGEKGVRRSLSYYNVHKGSVCTFATPYETGESTLWDGIKDGASKLAVFPNPNSAVYTEFSLSTAYSEARPQMSEFFLTSNGNWHDKKRYRLGDPGSSVVKYKAAVDTGTEEDRQSGLPWEDEVHQVVMAPNVDYGEAEEHFYKIPMNGGDFIQNNPSNETGADPAYESILSTEVTDRMSSSTKWITFSTITEDSTKKWNGSLATSIKIFYKLSLVYDGYQESALLTSISNSEFAKSSAIAGGLKWTITIDSNHKLPRRVTALALYRAENNLNTANNPDSLYRFITEIPLTDFTYSTSNNNYTYVYHDTGETHGSYSSINGIPETMNTLYINYTYCTEQNGYMFIGKCYHEEFGDANNVIFRSQPGKFSIFNWSVDFAEVPFTPTALVGFMGKVYVFGKTELAILNPETLVIEDTIKGVGCVGPKAIHTSSSGLFWFDESNIYSASPRISKIGTSILMVDTYGWNNLASSVKSSAVSGFDMNRQTYLVFFTTGSDKRCWAYSASMNRWDLWETDKQVMDTENTSDGYALLLLKDGSVAKYLSHSTDKRNWEWQSKKITFGNDTIFKKIRVAKVDASNRAATSLHYKTDISTEAGDWQAGTENSNNYGSAWLGKSTKIDSAHSKARWAKIKVAGTNTTTTDFRGYSLGLIYKPKRPK